MHHDVNSVRSARRWSTVMWSIKERMKLFFGALPNILDSRSFHHRCNVNLIIEKILSNLRRVTRLKLKFRTLFLLLLQCLHHASWCNRRSIGSTMIDRDVIHWRKKETLLWRSFKHLESESFDQRCNVNLIIGRVLSRIVFLQKSAVDRHHERITV